MKNSELEILKILLLELMGTCVDEDTDNCSLTISNERCDIVADITFAIRKKESVEE